MGQHHMFWRTVNQTANNPNTTATISIWDMDDRYSRHRPGTIG